MRFEIVATAFDAIEKTAKRLDMTSQMAVLMKETPASDARMVIYLTQGRLAPPYENIETGMGEKFVVHAIARSAGYTKEEVEKRFKKTGDLGETAFELLSKKKQQALVSQVLSVKKVHENFLKLARITGEGTQDTKIKLLSELLNFATPTEAKFIIRFALGSLRLGVGDPTIMDALARVHLKEFKEKNPAIVKSVQEDKAHAKKDEEEMERKIQLKLRELIEAKYNIHSDLGHIAELLADKGLKGLDELDIEPGVPIRPTLAERLPSSKEIIEKLGKCAVEAKYDGFRCVTGFTPIYVQRKGLISINEVQIGDFVLTHRGRFKKVVDKNIRTIDKKERLFSIQSYLGNEFKISEGHRILVERNGQKWIPVEHVKKTDQLIFTMPKIQTKSIIDNKLNLTNSEGYAKTIHITHDFYRFLGYWIGDGYSNDFHNTERIGIIFNHKTEQPLSNTYEKIVKKLFEVEKISRNIHNGATYLYWRDAPFKKWLTQHFRREWKGKMIPEWFYGINKKQFESFLQGWVESDGHTDELNRTAITTKERDLAMNAQLLALKFGIIIGVRKIRVKLKTYTGTYYKLIISKSERKAKILNGKLLVKILKLEEIKYPDPRTKLFNLQVEEDKSYCSTTISLHNCQIHKNGKQVKIFSRNQENMTDMFPEIVLAATEQLDAQKCIVEGEALAYNEKLQEFYPFQVTIQRKRKYDIEEKAKELPLKLFLFDCLLIEKKNLMPLPFEERRAHLKKLILSGETIEMTKSIITDKTKEVDKFFNENVSSGLEGIVCKDLHAPYIAGARKYAWIKLKRSYKGELQDSVDLVILGYFKGKGKRTEFGLGGLLCGVYDEERDEFKSISKIGTGFSEQMLGDLEVLLSKHQLKHKHARVDSEIEPDFWVEPKFVIEVRADEITQSPLHTAGRNEEGIGYALRFPRILKLREDKKGDECTTVKEIIKMHENQKKVKIEDSQ